MRWRAVVLLMGSPMFFGAWSSAFAGSPGPLPLSARLLKPGEFADFTLQGHRKSYTSAQAWYGGGHTYSGAQLRAAVAHEERLGFKVVMYEVLFDPMGGWTASSSVVQYGSASSARASLAGWTRIEKEKGYARITLQAGSVPGLLGFIQNVSKYHVENVHFVDGPFSYAVSQEWIGLERNPLQAALIAAVTRLYERVRGHPAR